MTYEEIFKMAKEQFLKSDVSGIEGHLAVEIDIEGEGEGAFYVELKDGILDIQPYEYYDRDVKLIATAENFLKIVDGSLNAVLAYTTGKLRVEGDLGKALELQKIIDSVKKAEKKKRNRKKQTA